MLIFFPSQKDLHTPFNFRKNTAKQNKRKKQVPINMGGEKNSSHSMANEAENFNFLLLKFDESLGKVFKEIKNFN